MNKHKSFLSFALEDWYWWLLGIVAYSFVVHWIWPDKVMFWSAFWFCINFRMLYRCFDAVEELWTRTELLRKDDEES